MESEGRRSSRFRFLAAAGLTKSRSETRLVASTSNPGFSGCYLEYDESAAAGHCPHHSNHLSSEGLLGGRCGGPPRAEHGNGPSLQRVDFKSHGHSWRGTLLCTPIQGLGLMNLLRIPKREETSIFTIASRRKTFTVSGLIFMRSAISLLVKPSSRSPMAWPSRGVRWYCWQIVRMSA